MQWYIEVLKKYVVFRGRARRKEYWMFTLFSVIFGLAALLLDVLVGTYDEETQSGIISNIYTLAVFLPTIAVSVRRLHDVGKSGFLLLLPLTALVPLLFAIPSLLSFDLASAGMYLIAGLLILLGTGIYLLYLNVKDSDPGVNKYGPNPKEESIVEYYEMNK